MFLAIVFIVLGAFMLLNALGIVTGSAWGLLWGIIVLAIGLRLLAKKGKCPICGIHAKIHGDECCDCECDHEEKKQN